jgi:uncharacterized membrane protein
MLLLAMAVMSLGLLIPVPVVRAVIVLPLALIVPGSALLAMLFGARARRDSVPALVAAVVLSMVIYVLLALLLALLNVAISALSVVMSTDCVVLALLAVAAWRSRQLAWHATSVDQIDRWEVQAPARSPALPTRSRLREIFNLADAQGWTNMLGVYRFVSIALVVVAALAVAIQVLPKAVEPPFSQFYFAGDWAKVSSVASAAPNGTLQVTVGITNDTHQRTRYVITVLLDEHTTWVKRTVTVASGAAWRGALSGVIPSTGCLHLLSFNLTEGSHGDPAGGLTLWAHGANGSAATCTRAP